MSTGYSWEGIRQVRAMLLGARHVPERLCGGYVYLGRYIKCSTFTFTFTRRHHETNMPAIFLQTVQNCDISSSLGCRKNFFMKNGKAYAQKIRKCAV